MSRAWAKQNSEAWDIFPRKMEALTAESLNGLHGHGGEFRGYVRVISTCYLGLGHCICFLSFPGGSVVKNSLANAGDARDVGLIPVSGRSSGEGNGNPLQYSCLGNPMDSGLQSIGLQKSRT